VPYWTREAAPKRKVLVVVSGRVKEYEEEKPSPASEYERGSETLELRRGKTRELQYWLRHVF